ncbi:MAG: hypothetical protein L6243_07085 [Candidatus Altiarchaeales archaeon]|nr:nucleotide-binding protein [Candidatus Altiarchaeota archaeon]MBU4342086.1 nucleotide-binding protein [Candidatus Altiarchaeota archaeon]MBU4436829.1 nucleotide-binding protein [Candidatus Altiarchaeota archaeon]MCG2783335.1 hypothetical protein [Candidatus Altiarchaeales archaeon]
MEGDRTRLNNLSIVLNGLLRNLTHHKFDPKDTQGHFEEFASIRDGLILSSPRLFEHLSTREIKPINATEFEGRGYFTRQQLKTLQRGVDSCLAILSQQPLDNTILADKINARKKIAKPEDIYALAIDLAKIDLSERKKVYGWGDLSPDNETYFEARKKWHISNIDKLSPLTTNLLADYEGLYEKIRDLIHIELGERKNIGYIRNIDALNYFRERRDELFLKSVSELKRGTGNELGIEKNNCFISDERTCNFRYIDEKLVFIAGSGDEEFKDEVKTLENVLEEKGYEPYFALSKREYNFDAFCKKICSKIHKSKFCIIMLNNPIHKDAKKDDLNIRTSSANVYFEYGLITALRKKAIPIIRKNQKLPFNVQNLDAELYEDKEELYKKMKDAID